MLNFLRGLFGKKAAAEKAPVEIVIIDKFPCVVRVDNPQNFYHNRLGILIGYPFKFPTNQKEYADRYDACVEEPIGSKRFMCLTWGLLVGEVKRGVPAEEIQALKTYFMEHHGGQVVIFREPPIPEKDLY